MILEEKNFSFDYKKAFAKDEFADAYEKLLVNMIKGDQTLFVSTDEIMASWRFIDSIIGGWQRNLAPLLEYKKGEDKITRTLLPGENQV